MSFPTLQSLLEAKKKSAVKSPNDEQVDFVYGWAEDELRDYDSLADAEAEFWSRVNDDEDLKDEAEELNLTKPLVRDILTNIADNMGIMLEAANSRMNHSVKMQKAIAALVQDDGEDPLSDDEVRVLAKKFGLDEKETKELLQIADGPIGY